MAMSLLVILVLLSGSVSCGQARPIYKNPNASVDARVDDLIARMTLDEKIGQMVQPERKYTTAAAVKDDFIGSVLSGGGSAPSPNTPEAWADLYDSYQQAAMSTRLGIPILYGFDAVHGANNIYGATIFPHNIGLGATRDADLVRRVSQATAEEIAGTGIDWTFAPCLCVGRDERWGRTYECFGEDPALVSSFAGAIDGYQGASLDAATSVLATAKHYAGDGGTTDGVNMGDTELAEAEFRRLHLAPYVEAINHGVGAIMVSFSSWNGQRLHDHEYLITTVLKGELGFKGIVISDWEGIHHLDGTYADQIRASVNAGVDVFMEPMHKTFVTTLRDEVNAGRVPMARIDDAVRRILTKKFEMGLFERPYADRTYLSSVGSSAHRDLAREAVRKSLVLLKNTDNLLPLSKTQGKIFVAGKNADNIGNQSGGWTISWQGVSGNITPGTTILQGIRNAVGAGVAVTYDRDASSIDSSYSAAIVVVGETPYAESSGDRTDLSLASEDINTINKVKSSGVPMAVVLVSGRPMIVTDQLDAAQAFVAAWLPGTEGQGVADVLFGDDDFTGKLPFSWPRSMAQLPINAGDADYDPLFAYGYGLNYGAAPRLP